jgi:hypothetical protein
MAPLQGTISGNTQIRCKLRYRIYGPALAYAEYTQVLNGVGLLLIVNVNDDGGT